MKITEIAKSNNISIMLYDDYYFNFDCPVSREGKLLIPISVITRCNVVINNTTNEIIKNRYPICSSEFFLMHFIICVMQNILVSVTLLIQKLN